jgi:putative ABC transport system ATP-binding protein
MSVFQRLNREVGLTVVLVTHEPDIAQYATRVIVVRDGLITRDTAVYERRDAAAEIANMPPPETELEEMPV